MKKFNAFAALAESDSEHSAQQDAATLERRKDEMDVLKAMYEDEVEFDEEEVRLHVRAAENYSCTVRINLGEYYPHAPPRRIYVTDWPVDHMKGSEAKELTAALTSAAKEHAGEEVVAQLWEIAHDFMFKRSPHRGSLHAMAEQRQAEEVAEQQREDERLAQENDHQQKKEAEEWGELREKLQEERQNRKSMVGGRRRNLSMGSAEDYGEDSEGGGGEEGEGDQEAPASGSRFDTEYKVICDLGEGGGGKVVKVQNRLDKRIYAVKIIRPRSQKIVREILTLSRLFHPNIVRYYSAWQQLEDVDTQSHIDSLSDEYRSSGGKGKDAEEVEEEEDSGSGSGAGFWATPLQQQPLFAVDSDDEWNDEDGSGSEDTPTSVHFSLGERWDAGTESPISSNAGKTSMGRLFIQMEFCNRDLRAVIDEGGLVESREEAWRLMRQLLEALEYIHLKKIIHRDLKPGNVFIDNKGDVKLGDFGLAVGKQSPMPIEAAEQDRQRKDSVSGASRDDESQGDAETTDLTSGVGTTLYRAPEQEVGHHYNEKVDIYALGIVFFEMLTRFDTGMERITTLQNLRNNIFPDGFEDQYPEACVILGLCCALDPSKRPSATELLANELIPSKLEVEEEFLHALTSNPNTKSFRTLIDGVFSNHPVRRDVEFDWEADHTVADQAHNTDLLQRIIMHIFEIHNSSNFQAPLLRPKTEVLTRGHLAAVAATANVMEVIERSGALLVLPSELSSSFARWIAHQDISRFKRGLVSRVYFSNERILHQPSERMEACFDIIDNRKNSAPYFLAEAILVGKELATTLQPFFGEQYSATIRLGHIGLVLGLLELCDIDIGDPAIFPILREVIRSFSILQPRAGASLASQTVEDVHTKLSLISKEYDRKGFQLIWKALPKCPLKALEELRLRADKVYKRRTNTNSSSRATRETFRKVTAAISNLQRVCDILMLLGVLQPEEHDYDPYPWCHNLAKPHCPCIVLLDLGICDRHGIFNSGLTFDISVCPEAIMMKAREKKQNHAGIRVAEGGEYNDVVTQFQPPMTSGDVVAVGSRVSINRLSARLGSQDISVMCRRFAQSSPAYRPLVLVVAEDRGGEAEAECVVFAERLLVANMLWDSGLSTEWISPLQIRSFNLNEIRLYCGEKGIGHLVVIKQRVFQNEGLVKYVAVGRDKEFQNIHFNDLPRTISVGAGATVGTGAKKRGKKSGKDKITEYRCPFCEVVETSATAITIHQASHLSRDELAKLRADS